MVHVGDASLVTAVCSDLLNPAKREGFIGDLRAEQAELREAYDRQQPAVVIPLAEARKRPLITTAPVQPAPRQPGVTLFERIDPAAVAEIIDWTPFFITWSLKGSFPGIFKSPKVGEEARKLFDAARVEPSVEEIDDFALARGFVAGDDEQNGKRGVLERDLHLDERTAQGGHAGFVIFFWEARRAVCLRHEGEKWRGGAELSRLGSYFGGGRRFVTERVVTPPVGVKEKLPPRSRLESQWAPPEAR
ncbi:hypothetical protein EBR16_09365 [bacterium]|nr:hypothetical protein [bacterium]